MAEMEGDDDVPKIKLGDASCAAPFTSKLAHVSAGEPIFHLEYHERLIGFSYTYHSAGPVHSRCHHSDVQDPRLELSYHRIQFKCAIS